MSPKASNLWRKVEEVPSQFLIHMLWIFINGHGSHSQYRTWVYSFEVLSVDSRWLRAALVVLLRQERCSVTCPRSLGRLDSWTSAQCMPSSNACRGHVKSPCVSVCSRNSQRTQTVLHFRSLHLLSLQLEGQGHYTCTTYYTTTRRFLIFQVLRETTFIFLW